MSILVDMERELYCAPCDQVYTNRAEHYRKIKPDSWMAINVPVMPPVEIEEKPVERRKRGG